jgi:hypothetical protein
LALAHASRGGKCKRRGISHPCRGAEAERKGRPQAGLHKRTGVPAGVLSRWGGEVRKTGDTSCRAPGTESLSVLSTCVTKQTKDLRYMGRGTLMVPEPWSYAR